MSRLISRILLTILMFPLAGLVYTVMAFLGHEGFLRDLFPSGDHGMWVFVISGLATWCFIAVYWLALWFGSVHWNLARLGLIVLAVGATVMGGVLIGGAVSAGFDRRMGGFGAFVGSAAAPLLWLVATILIFRETPGERRARLDQSKQALLCPTCGYNLTGLTSTRCPECGATFTLEQLLLNQPSRAAAELERT